MIEIYHGQRDQRPGEQQRGSRDREAVVYTSVDQVFSHIKWVEWIKDNLDVEITFPIVAANDAIALKLGMLHPGKGTNTVRAVFVVDQKGVVRYEQIVGEIVNEPDYEAALRAAKKLVKG